MADKKLKVFYASVCGNVGMRKNQQKIFNILDSKKIEYEKVDITQCSEHKDEMRRLAKDPKALPPQIFNGDTCCGDYDEFEKAVEAETLDTFLKI